MPDAKAADEMKASWCERNVALKGVIEG